MDAALPPNAVMYLPVLRQEIEVYWPLYRWPAMLAAQVENESCISLKSPSCWNPHAELKTAREYGFGLGQITITSAFNNFTAAQRLDPSLAHWQYDDRYDARFQLRTLVLTNARNYKLTTGASDIDTLAFMFAAYNGGLGGLYSDQRVCRGTAGCIPNRWFGNVELTSLKARVPVAGYGETFFTTNHCYPWRVIYLRRPKYDKSFPDVGAVPASFNGLNCK